MPDRPIRSGQKDGNPLFPQDPVNFIDDGHFQDVQAVIFIRVVVVVVSGDPSPPSRRCPSAPQIGGQQREISHQASAANTNLGGGRFRNTSTKTVFKPNKEAARCATPDQQSPDDDHRPASIDCLITTRAADQLVQQIFLSSSRLNLGRSSVPP
ncbi:hypothetical protein ACLOJK_006805 [Asimina triloba]